MTADFSWVLNETRWLKRNCFAKVRVARSCLKITSNIDIKPIIKTKQGRTSKNITLIQTTMSRRRGVLKIDQFSTSTIPCTNKTVKILIAFDINNILQSPCCWPRGRFLRAKPYGKKHKLLRSGWPAAAPVAVDLYSKTRLNIVSYNNSILITIIFKN